MVEFPDIRIAFGESDEYSFVLHKDTQVYGKRYVYDMGAITTLRSKFPTKSHSKFRFYFVTAKAAEPPS